MTTVKTKYGFSDSMIARFLPEPELVRNRHYSTTAPMRSWSESLVQTIAEKPEVKAELEKLRNRREKKKEKDADNRQKAIEALTKFGFDGMLEQARRFPRMFYIHCGPTNSGKTYQALEALKGAENGVYLGPLRLLACEVYDTLNDSDVPCRLLTGEEHIEV